MHEHDIEKIAAWVTERALAGASETELLHGFCERVNAVGLPVSSGVAVVDTLHPIWEGRAFLWRNDGVEEEPTMEYGSTREGEAAERWKSTGFYHLLETGADEVRRRIGFGDPTDFHTLDKLKEQGHTDYLAFVQRFPREAVIGEMDAIFSHWTTRDRTASAKTVAPRCGAWFRRWRSASNALLSRASPKRSWRSILEKTPADACSKAASPAERQNASAPCCGSPIFVVTPRWRTRSSPAKSFRF
jgi:hypothetical protein